MKLKTRHLSCAYLGDGTLVALYGRWDPTFYVQIDWAEIYEAYAETTFEGRIVFHGGLLGLLPGMKGASVRMQTADVKHGSQKTKEMGLAVDGIHWITKDGLWADISSIPGLISAGYTLQPAAEGSFEEFAGESRWSAYPVTKVHRIARV